MPKKETPVIDEDTWFNRSVQHVRLSSELGRAPMRGFGMVRKHPDLDSIVITPAQAARLPNDSMRTLVETKVVIGSGLERPLTLERPYMMAPLSLGALSTDARRVLVKAAAEHDITFNAAEGGLSPEEAKTLANGGKVIAQMASGRFSVDLDGLRSADAVEISLGHGSKPGMGGILFAEKITDEMSEIRALPKGADALSPSKHLDMDTPEDIKYIVEMVRETTDRKIPILLKFGAGNLIDDVKIAVEAGVDAIVVDASEAIGTAVPSIVGNEVGTPILGIFGGVQRGFKLAGMKDSSIKLIVNGGMMTSADIFKALAMGADAVGLDLPFLVAMGCTGCYENCVKGDCRVGITGEPGKLPKGAARGVDNYIKALDQELRMLIALTGHHSITEVGLDDVRGMTYEAATVAGVKLMGYERVLPMWQH